jgi:superfamily I DNA/RNA helicase/mRNA-degrading endonuclease RelE of RelBE toxin-antitoxin system
MTAREINMTPSFAAEIHQFPKELAAQLWEKIDFLLHDPIPDGMVKKKLKNKKSLYRMRIGQYRLFYTFGETWVRLLTVRRRDGKTYANGMAGIESAVPETTGLGSELDNSDFDDEGSVDKWQEKAFEFKPEEASVTRLPLTIDSEFLNHLDIEAGYFPSLCACESEDALLNAAIPSDVLEKVLDHLFPKPIEDIIQEPSLVVGSLDELARFKDGDLITFLLKLDAEQERLVKRALKGPTLVKGGAGTGKSTVALYRVKAMLDNAPDDASLLFTTFTRALTSVSRQLLELLLTEEQFKRVNIVTCDELVRKTVQKQRTIGELEEGNVKSKVLAKLRKSFTPDGDSNFNRKLKKQSLDELTNEYLLEEFDWIITGRNIGCEQTYIETSRKGRKRAFREAMRRAVWGLYQAFQQTLSTQKLECYAELRREAYGISVQKKPNYDFVVVDEAQDLTPVASAFLAELCKQDEGIFFAADTKQSIYNKGGMFFQFSERLNFRGRTAVLKNNYRSTEQIDRAAFSVLGGQEDLSEESISKLTGPKPICLVNEGAESGFYIASYLRQMCKFLRVKFASAAVLVPNQYVGKTLVEELSMHGIDARFYPGREIDLASRQVKVMTLHSAKGLEFPIVCLADLDAMARFMPEDDEEFYEWQSEKRRLLYVGMTRAMRGLLVVKPSDDYFGINDGFDSEYWHVEEVR